MDFNNLTETENIDKFEEKTATLSPTSLPLELDYHSLNAKLNLVGEDGKLQFEADKEATRQYFLQHVNQNTVYFNDLKEKIDYLVENKYYETDTLDLYDFDFIKSIYKKAYSYKFRFTSFMGAFKYYTSYTLKTFDGTRYLERYEDRVAMVALYLAQGDKKLVESLLDEMMSGRFQPATPTFLNAGKAQRGELISCFLLSVEDNMESIGRAINSSLQLSKRGGGVALNLTNLRETGAPIKKIENLSSGVVPVMKILEDSFSYANQLGARQGAGAVYLHAHHPDIMNFLDTKRENADSLVRIKSLSLGIVMPDITFELAKNNADMHLFSPYDIQQEYGKSFSEINITEMYDELVANPKIRSKTIKARRLFQTIAELQFESGYPYLLFIDNANKANNIDGKITMSNLCVTGDTKLLTDSGYISIKSLYDNDKTFDVIVDERARTMNLENIGTSTQKSTKAFLTAKDAEVYKLSTNEGFELKATEWHKMYVEREKEIIKIPLSEVEVGDKILIQSDVGSFGDIDEPELAYLTGVIAGDGTISRRESGNLQVRLSLFGDKISKESKIKNIANYLIEKFKPEVNTNALKEVEFKSDERKGRGFISAPLGFIFEKFGVNENTKLEIPDFVLNGTKETQIAYLSGLFMTDGSFYRDITLTSINKKLLLNIQKMLLNFKVYSQVCTLNNGKTTFGKYTNKKGEVVDFERKVGYKLNISRMKSKLNLIEILDLRDRHFSDAQNILNKAKETKILDNRHYATVSSIEFFGVEDVYDVTVENGHSVIFDGIVTGNCSEILQVSEPSTYNQDGSYSHVGKDISCNLGSLNIAKVYDGEDFGKTIESSIRALTAVSDLSDISSVPSIEKGNRMSHAVGLGAMNLHGFLAREEIHYDSEEAVDFTNLYFYAVLYQALKASNLIAKERNESFVNFEKSKYFTGEAFQKYIDTDWSIPKTDKVKQLFENSNIYIPTPKDWEKLKTSIKKFGMYNQNLLAVAPTGSISYLSNSTSSIHPVASPIEIRKERLGRVYYPAPYMTNDNIQYYRDAYKVGPEAIIDVYTAATQHVDQGLSLTVFFTDEATSRDLNKAYIYAWRRGIKSLYYIRIKQLALDGTEIEGQAAEYCESCQV